MQSKLLYFYQFLKNLIDDFFFNQLNEKKVLKNYLPKKIIYFDIGYNVGFESNKIRNIYNKNCRIHAFEPIPNLNTKIPKDIKYNNVGISFNTKNKVKFIKRKISSSSSLKKNQKKINLNDEIIYIKTISLSDYCKKNKIKNISYIKIDTEGNELDCLKSLRKYINVVKLIKIEITQENAYEIFEYLNKKSFKFIGIINTKYKNQLFYYGNAFFLKKNKK